MIINNQSILLFTLHRKLSANSQVQTWWSAATVTAAILNDAPLPVHPLKQKVVTSESSWLLLAAGNLHKGGDGSGGCFFP